MRFSLICSVFLGSAILASGLVVPQCRRNGCDISVRSELVGDGVETVLEQRSPRTSNAKKARIAANKPIRAAQKAANKQRYAKAAKAHKATTNLPARQSVFKVAAGNVPDRPALQFSGKDVRKVVFESHMKKQKGRWMNKENQVPNPGTGTRPLNHMKVDLSKVTNGQERGRETRLGGSNNRPGPARVITQKTKAGHYTFKGVVAHDQTRTQPPPGVINGYMDHFQVKERKVNRPRRM